MSEEFKIGDTVRLKSGGPLMTIKAISTSRVICTWFNIASVAWTPSSYRQHGMPVDQPLVIYGDRTKGTFPIETLEKSK